MTDLEQRIAEIRRFNRFYTRQIGVLPEGHLQSLFSLTEVRVLYELAHREKLTASDLGKELGLDAGYLSRLLRGFASQGFLQKRPSPSDARQSLLELTPAGRAAFAPLNAAARNEIGAMLRSLPEAGQTRLIDAMHRIEALLGAAPARAAPGWSRNASASRARPATPSSASGPTASSSPLGTFMCGPAFS